MTSIRKFIVEYRGFLLFVLLLFVFRSSFADWNRVPTGSMIPTILIGDHIFVDKMAYDLRIPFTHKSLKRFADPERGDIIVFDSEENGTRLVKRVIGVPGDVIQLQNNLVTINGKPLRYRVERYLSGQTHWREDLLGIDHLIQTLKRSSNTYDDFGPIEIGPDHYFVMGDNRDNSHDSRAFGLVSRDVIVGKTESVVLSLNYDNYYLPRSDRFFESLDPNTQ